MTEWKYKDTQFKAILSRNNSDNEKESVEGTKEELLPYLKGNPIYNRLPASVIKKIEHAKTFYTLNNALNDIYDYADDNRIWFGFMPMGVKPI